MTAGACTQCGTEVPRRVVPYYDAAEALCPACVSANVIDFGRDGWSKGIADYPPSTAAVVGLHFGRLVLFCGGVARPAEIRPLHALELLERAAKAHGAGQLWFHESALEPLGLPLEQPRRRPSDVPEVEQAWRRHDGLEVAVPAWEGHTGTDGQYRNRSPWARTSNALELSHELGAFEATVGHRWIRSGAITSDAMLADHWGGRIKPAELPGEWATAALEQPDHVVNRNLVDLTDVAAMRYCYAFDLNANYLGAASNLHLPVGAAIAVGGSEHDLVTPVTQPGYWDTETGWRTTPGIGERRALAGWLYPGSHQYLQPWYRALRDARALLPRGSAALRAVKAIYQMGPGRLLSTRRGSSPYTQRMYQPYWQQAVVASARERLRRRIVDMRQAPVAIDVDAAFFLSDRPDPRIFAAFVGLRLGTALGEWHVIGRCTGAEAAAALKNPDDLLAIGELREAVKS